MRRTSIATRLCRQNPYAMMRQRMARRFFENRNAAPRIVNIPSRGVKRVILDLRFRILDLEYLELANAHCFSKGPGYRKSLETCHSERSEESRCAFQDTARCFADF